MSNHLQDELLLLDFPLKHFTLDVDKLLLKCDQIARETFEVNGLSTYTIEYWVIDFQCLLFSICSSGLINIVRWILEVRTAKAAKVDGSILNMILNLTSFLLDGEIWWLRSEISRDVVVLRCHIT